MDLVVGALSGMVDALPGKLGELLEAEYALLSGCRDDVAFLRSELGSMRAAIHHCESLDHPDSQTVAWIGRIRELAYDIEDWVSLFGVRVDSGAGTGASSSGFFGLLRRGVDKIRTLPDRHHIAGELQELKKRVVELSEQRHRYSCVLPVPAAARPTDPRLATLFVDPGSLVGLDGPLEELSKIVKDADGGTELKIVSIVGMAGAGKTTLANAFYHRPEVQNCFQCRVFVSIGQKPDMIKVLKDILLQLRDGHRADLDISQLIDSIRNLLKDKSEADAKRLFLKKAFGNEHACPKQLEDVVAQIMRRCDGLPLAIVSRAGMLAHNQSRDQWVRLNLNPLCSSHPDGSDGVKQILNLSYNNLPSHLKTCLLYLSIFPENSEVDTARLVRRWIAEGFITESRSVSAEETAISYLNELISRNLVKPLDPNHDGVPRRCTVHPVIHDFIVCKSMEENFVTLVDAQLQDVSAKKGTIRRLSLHNSCKEDQPAARNEPMDLSHARSITVFGHASAVPCLTNLKVVRVLDFEGCNGLVRLDGLCKLVLLRYLSLKGTAANGLPETIGDLKCLETLDVRSTKVEELPPGILRLEKLMHLLAGSAKLPKGIAKMKALQTLSCSGTTKSTADTIEEISEHDNLRELELCYDATEMPENKKRVMFPSDGLPGVKKLCIRDSPAVTFEPKALKMVQVLELNFQKGLADGSSSVSGIEHLSNLKCVIMEFSEDDTGAMATVNTVRAALEVPPNHPEVTIKVEGNSH